MILNVDYRNAIDMLGPESVQLLWTDPPFGTGQAQRLRSTLGTDFQYKDYDSLQAVSVVVDMMGAVAPKLRESAVVAICLDHRIVHETKVFIEQQLSDVYKYEREIIYHFELGATSRNWWTNKHNTILLWSMRAGAPLFNKHMVPTVPRKAGRGSYDSAERKVNSVWTITLGPSDRQRTGYPNQKPLALVEPFVLVHSDLNDLVFDPFAGSGTVGVAAKRNSRHYVVNDLNPEAFSVMQNRLEVS